MAIVNMIFVTIETDNLCYDSYWGDFHFVNIVHIMLLLW